MKIELNAQELTRYKRQILLFGPEKQKKLKEASVFVAGAGGLGSPACIYLAAAGIGTLTVCDFDNVELSNLNRQVLHGDAKLGKNKAVSALETQAGINKFTAVIPVNKKLDRSNAADIIGSPDIIIDCLDNFETRFVINEYAVRERIPLVFGAVYGTEGQVSFIRHPKTFCLACVFEGAPPKEEFPIIGATAGVIGSLQALEAVKYITETGENLENVLLTWDGLKQEFRKVEMQKDPSCEICGK
jgi:molybdopterin/thiamine biosynthesis adenylyltransferase